MNTITTLRTMVASAAVIVVFFAPPNAKALDELERLTDEGIQSACHGYVLHDVVERLAAWFEKDSPLCKRVLTGEPGREVLADLRRQGWVARGGTADFRALPNRIDMECDHDVLCVRERRRAEASGNPMSMVVFEHVRNHCQNTWPQGIYGCIEGALANWPEVRLPRAVRMLPLTGQFVTQTETALRREPAEAAAVVAQLHSNRPLDARARSEDGRWLEVRDELSGASGYVLTSQVTRIDARPTAATGASVATGSSAASVVSSATGSGVASGIDAGSAVSTATPRSLDIDALVRSGQVGRQHQTNEAVREAERIEEEGRAEEARREAERQRQAREQAEREQQERQRAERLARQQREEMQAARREAQRQQNMSALLAGVQSLTQDMVAMRQQQHAQSLQAQRELDWLSGLSSSIASTSSSGGSSGSTPQSASPSRTAPTTSTIAAAPTSMDAAELCQRMGGRWTGASCAVGTVASATPSLPNPAWNAASGGARQPMAGETVQLDSSVMGAIAAQRNRTVIRPNAFEARGRGSARDCDRYSDMQLVTMCFHAGAAYLEYEKAALLGVDQAQQDRLYAAHETTVNNLLRLVDW